MLHGPLLREDYENPLRIGTSTAPGTPGRGAHGGIPPPRAAPLRGTLYTALGTSADSAGGDGSAIFGGKSPAAPTSAIGGTSTGGNTSTGGTSTGGSSGGTPTPVPEPEQMALFAMGAAVLVGRVMVSRRKRK